MSEQRSVSGGMGGGMGQQRRNRPIPGEDERYDIQLDFLDAIFGTQYVSLICPNSATLGAVQLHCSGRAAV